MTFEELKNITEQYQLSTGDEVVAVGYGNKTVSGSITEEKSIIFTVKEKKSLDQLRPEELLPELIKIDGIDISTDVIQGIPQLVVGCDPDFISWQTDLPINRETFRPLRSGVSVTNFTKLSNYVGTMGFIAIDNENGSLVGVSNNHVLINDAFIASDRSIDGVKTNVDGDLVVQPNEPGNSRESNSIGLVKKYVPLRTTGFNYADAAMTTLSSTDIDGESWIQVGLSTVDAPPRFATTGEIDIILSTNSDLFSAGRTTGAKGEGLTKLKPFASPVAIQLNYDRQGVEVPVTMSRCFEYIAEFDGNQCPYPIAGGDSGSAILTYYNNEWLIIGLAFAGVYSTNPDTGLPAPYFGVANRIDDVVSSLNISAWDGTSPNFSNLGQPKKLVIQGHDSRKVIVHEGLEYWQLGLVDSLLVTPNPTTVPSPTPTSTQIPPDPTPVPPTATPVPPTPTSTVVPPTATPTSTPVPPTPTPTATLTVYTLSLQGQSGLDACGFGYVSIEKNGSEVARLNKTTGSNSATWNSGNITFTQSDIMYVRSVSNGMTGSGCTSYGDTRVQSVVNGQPKTISLFQGANYQTFQLTNSNQTITGYFIPEPF